MKVPLIKVTIISESLLKDEILSLIQKEGATGYTLTKVEGEGTRGVRAMDWEGRNIRIDTIVTSETADAILAGLNVEYFEDYAVIAWLSEVNVLRGEKFVGGDAAPPSKKE
ncbi:MAG: transcriptional regulator [Verrucomicrobiota bacterium]